MDIKLLALDLDGTLMMPDGTITDRSINAINAAVAKGVKIAICTGRSHFGFNAALAKLTMLDILITFGGAQIMKPDGEILFADLISHENVVKTANVLESLGLMWLAYTQDNFIFTKSSSFTELYSTFYSKPGDHLPDILDNGFTTPKMLCLVEQTTARDTRRQIQKLLPQMYVTSSYPIFVDIYNAGTDKGTALKFVTEYYGLNREQTMAIGDDGIDIPMIEQAGVGVAMGNSNPVLFEHANIITASNVEDGVAQAIEKYILAD